MEDGTTVAEATTEMIDEPMREDALVLTERFQHAGMDIAVLTFNRPEQRNPLDKATIKTLRRILTDFVEGDAPDAVVLTGSGKSFSAGGDLKGYQALYRDHDAFREFMTDFSETANLLERGPMLAVSMINGVCVAGGLELSLACDFITIADTAKIGDGHLKYAQLPGGGGSQRLVRAIGVQRARHWLLTGRYFDAQVAVDTGLAVLSAPGEELRERTLELLAELAALTPLGLRTMKRLIATALRTDLDEGLRIETSEVFEYATSSYDAMEGLNAFAERRPPRYKGR
jgi:enoyl-CoA hydratase